MLDKPVVALAKLFDYDDPRIDAIVGDLMDKANLRPPFGLKILVKPNLLLPLDLACSNPKIVAAVCRWTLDQGAKIVVGDSPAFGTVHHVAEKIGLPDTLKPLGVVLTPFNKARVLKATVKIGEREEKVSFKVASIAMDADEIYSIAKAKAHSQMRITLCVKNCFGCVLGWRKALLHAAHGQTTEIFAACLAELYRNLPVVRGVADGVVAMSRAGPSKGDPFSLGMLGASNSAISMDEAILAILNRSPTDFPLAAQFATREERKIAYPLLAPGDFDASGFVLPDELKPASFSPIQLIKSVAKRIWRATKRS